MTMTTVGNWYAQNGSDLAAKAALPQPSESALPLGWTPLRVLGAVAALREMGAHSERISGLLPPQRRDSGRRRPHRALDAVNLSVKSS